MSVVDDYLATISGPEHALLTHLYAVARQTIPNATEELSYNMPTFKYQGKGVIAILSNKNFLSLYPFCNVGRLGVSLAGYDTTTGSIHFTCDHPVSDAFVRQIISARLEQISA